MDGSRSRSTTSPAATTPKLAPLLSYLDGLTGPMDLSVVERLLSELDIGRDDVASSCVFGTKAYKRNTISRGEWHELVCICWRSGHCTPIHDHRASTCGFKVIEGVGTEIRFEQSSSGLICPVKTTRMEPGYLCVAEDKDIHQIANMQSAGKDLVTLHLYSPPLCRINTWKYAEATVEECEQEGAVSLYD